MKTISLSSLLKLDIARTDQLLPTLDDLLPLVLSIE